MSKIFENIKTLDELIDSLNKIKEECGGDTELSGISSIYMGVNDNNLDEYETTYNLNVSVFHDNFDNKVKLYVDGKSEYLQ